VAANACFVERFYPKAKVIQIACFSCRRRAASSAEFAAYGHEIKERSASTQLNQA